MHDRGTADAWQAYGKRMAGAKQLHGRCIASAWQVHGKCMADAWWVHGGRMTAAFAMFAHLSCKNGVRAGEGQGRAEVVSAISTVDNVLIRCCSSQCLQLLTLLYTSQAHHTQDWHDYEFEEALFGLAP